MDASRFPFPVCPTGWYSLGLSSELAKGQVRALRRFGRNLALFRAQSGTAALLDATCPHLGASLAMGVVEGEHLVCPFHQFRYDVEGQPGALPTGYSGRIPPRLACHRWELREVDGFLLTWYDAAGGAPAWEPPAESGEVALGRRSIAWTLQTHPQETGEGSVDLGHLRTVHQYLLAEPLHPLQTQGPFLQAAYRLERRTVFGMRGGRFRIEIHPHLHGLGFSKVRIVLPEYGIEYRVWVLATPIDNDHIDYRVAMLLDRVEHPGKLAWGLGLLPDALVRRIIGEQLWKTFVHDVELDFPIWENKEYLHPPTLMAGDGPIGQYRAWAAQFYRGASRAAVAS